MKDKLLFAFAILIFTFNANAQDAAAPDPGAKKGGKAPEAVEVGPGTGKPDNPERGERWKVRVEQWRAQRLKDFKEGREWAAQQAHGMEQKLQAMTPVCRQAGERVVAVLKERAELYDRLAEAEKAGEEAVARKIDFALGENWFAYEISREILDCNQFLSEAEKAAEASGDEQAKAALEPLKKVAGDFLAKQEELLTARRAWRKERNSFEQKMRESGVKMGKRQDQDKKGPEKGRKPGTKPAGKADENAPGKGEPEGAEKKAP